METKEVLNNEAVQQGEVKELKAEELETVDGGVVALKPGDSRKKVGKITRKMMI